MFVPVTVRWGEDSVEVAVTSVEELELLLDRIAGKAIPDQPTVASIERGDIMFTIAESRQWAIAICQYLQPDSAWLEHSILGDRDAEGVVVTWFAGEWTELMRWQCVEPQIAREAARFFFRTGGLWPAVSWIPNDVDSFISAQARHLASVRDATVSVTRGDSQIMLFDVQALDQLLDEVAAESNPDCPSITTVTRNEARLSIAQSATWAMLICYQRDGGLTHVSAGDPQAEGWVTVRIGSAQTQLPRPWCIQVDQAREATRHFQHTGGLWPGIAWESVSVRPDVNNDWRIAGW